MGLWFVIVDEYQAVFCLLGKNEAFTLFGANHVDLLETELYSRLPGMLVIKPCTKPLR